MLQRLREKTSGWIATVIIGLLIIPFAFVGLQDYLVQRGDTHVARINVPPAWWPGAPAWWPVSTLWDHEVISVDEFRNRFEQARQSARAEQGEAFDARAFESAENKRALLERMIDERVQAVAAEQAGLVVSDELVRREIMRIPAFQIDGRFSTERYQLALAAQTPPQSPRAFGELVREGLLQSFIATGLDASSFATPSEVDRVVKLMGEQRAVSLLMIPPVASAAPVSDADISAWYTQNAADFRAPETVTLEYVELDGSALPAAPPADEATLRRRYEQEKSRFAAPEERLASH
ncbi:MAG TPA: SurA N-terminal domain-containing protein, partial [Lysobacter sp.]